MKLAKRIRDYFFNNNNDDVSSIIVKNNPQSSVVFDKGVFFSLGKPKLICDGDLYISRGTSFHGDGEIKFGNGCFINNNCWFAASFDGGISLGNGCILGPNIVFVDNDHKYGTDFINGDCIAKKIVIGNNVWIGAGAIILKGTIVGDNCVIGAGSVVKGTFDNNSVIVGNPARIIKINERI